jgi:hypothetical protein
MLALWNGLGRIPSLSVFFGNSLRRTGVSSSLNVGGNSVLFTVTLFIIAKIGIIHQPMNGKENVAYTMKYNAAMKRMIPISYSKLNATRGYYIK